jgi:pyruvate dehydrogenase E2 component (dihydrolipoamide acetyltransferase)
VDPEELAAVRGSGPGGLITEKDAAAFLEAAPQSPEKAPSAAHRAAEGGRMVRAESVARSRARKVIADRMTASKREVPHFYLTVEVDMSAAQSLRRDCTPERGWSRPPSYTALITAACASTLAEMPEINVSYQNSALIRHDRIGVGIAVDSPEGLIVPVMRDADRLSLREISERLQEFRSPGFRLRDSHFGEKSMVVSNLGSHRVDAFFPIIDMPDSLILGVGRVRDRVVAVEGRPAVRPTVLLSLSVDHRVVDGVPAGRFLERVAARLEKPEGLVGEQDD